MKILFRVLLALGIIIMGYLLLTRYENSSNELKLSSKFNPKNNSIPSQRTWYKGSLTKIKLNSQINDSLFNPMIMKNYNGMLYIADFSDMRIKRFTKHGEYIDYFGENIGRGPSDFLLIPDFTVLEDTLYVIDTNALSIKLFNNVSRNHIRNIKLDYLGTRITELSGNLVTQSNLLPEQLFRIYDNQDSVSNVFGITTENEISNSLSFDGKVLTNATNNEIIYAPFYASYLFYFNEEGENVRTVRTIDRQGFPKSEHSSASVGAPNPDIQLYGTAQNEGYLFLQYIRAPLKNSKNPLFTELHSYIDIYTISGERYIGSIPLPYMTREISIIGNNLFLVNYNTNEIEVFELSVLN